MLQGILNGKASQNQKILVFCCLNALTICQQNMFILDGLVFGAFWAVTEGVNSLGGDFQRKSFQRRIVTSAFTRYVLPNHVL